MKEKLHEALKKYFGYDTFRGGQEELISSLINGKDAFGIMPTGAGKSICYQLPALLLEGISLVVSPLISLMKDQVQSLSQAGIPGAYLNSTLNPRQMEIALENAKAGKYKLIYVAPERLLAPDFLDFAKNIQISLLTVDEAHCISQWGQDFRPSYGQIPAFLALLPQRPIVSAFTATATQRVREDVVELLALKNPTVLVTGFDRTNLFFEVQAPKNKMAALFSFLEENKEKSGIIYCLARKTVEEVCEELNKKGFKAVRYHAGLGDRERHNNQEDFIFDRVQIMVATNAFGMGIDKSNVSFVVHYNMPKDIESYYQEAGRAGRDGTLAHCLLLYSGQDVRTNQWLIEHPKDVTYEDAQAEKLLKERDHNRLREMTFYSTSYDCLRGSILKYFGENPPTYCGACSNCLTKFDTVDVTVDAQKILSCVARMHQRFGAMIVIDVLRGSKNQRILEMNFNTLSTYGISEKSSHTLRMIIDFLVQEGYLEKSEEQYPVLRLTEASQKVLKGLVSLEMKLVKEKVTSQDKGKEKQGRSLPEDRQVLFTTLRSLRQKFAQEQNVPAFVVFADSALLDMCLRLPTNPEDFLKVSGVGERKAQQYGKAFLHEIQNFCAETGLESLFTQVEEETPKRVRKKKEVQGLVFPSTAILQTIKPLSETSPISYLTDAINTAIKPEGCANITPIRVGNWLISQGYLELYKEENRSFKNPTQKGLDLGISQEKRENNRGEYMINLYSTSAQLFIIEHIDQIIAFNKDEEK